MDSSRVTEEGAILVELGHLLDPPVTLLDITVLLRSGGWELR